MSKAISALSVGVLAITFLLSQAPVQARQIPEEDREIVDFWLGGMNGLWSGFYKGLYNNARVLNDQCLGDESKKELYQVLYFFAYGELSDIFGTADEASKLYFDNLENCNFYGPFVDIQLSCKNGNCTFAKILENCQAHLFQIFNAAGNLASLFNLKELDSPTEFYNLTFDLGHDVGKLISAILGI